MAILIIPAGGRASRMGMGAQPPGFSKCLLPIAGEPIIATTVSAAAGLHIRIVTRPDDERLHTWAASAATPQTPIKLVRAPFEAYPVTVLRCLGADIEAGIVDGDVAAAPDGLTAFFNHALANPNQTDITVATATDPAEFGPGTIWWSNDGRLSRAVEPHDARLAGAYWLRPPATAALRNFVADGRTSFHEFLAGYDQTRIDNVPIGYAYNINDPGTLESARTRIGARELRVEHLVLRTWRPGDIDELARLFADPAFSWHPYRRPRVRRDAAEFVAAAIEHWAARGIGRYAITDGKSGDLLGYAGLGELGWPQHDDAMEFGIRLAAESCARGLGMQVGRAVIADGFARTACAVAVATVEADNEAALRLVKRLGFEETARQIQPVHGTSHVVSVRHR